MRQISYPLRVKKLHIVLFLFSIAFLSSCNINRFVPEGQHLVKSNKIIIENDHKEVSKSELSDYISLKPYKEFYQSNRPAWFYYHAQRRPNSKFWRWLNKNFGKEPVYYDKIEADNSSKQMMRYLDNVGYFNSKVTHSVIMQQKKAIITYHVYPNQPYYINELEYDIGDSLMERYIMRDSASLPLRKGQIYNAYDMNEQRDIITNRLKNSGYYFFNRDEIYYEVDSNFMNHSMKVTMHVKDNKLAHQIYKINRINVFPEFSLYRRGETITDSTTLTVELGRRRVKNTLHSYHYGKPKVKPSTFATSIQIYQGRPYRLNNITRTYEALSNYRIFSNVNIEFDTLPSHGDSLHLLNCRITMQQVNKHSFTLQAEGTRSDSDLGIKGSLSYNNKNFFRGAESFQLSLKYGVEAQNRIDMSENAGERHIFNTQEFGISASIRFPRFLSFFNHTDFARDYLPSTSIAAGYNLQIRYFYSRYISTASFGYDWKSSNRVRHTLTPVYFNSVKIANINPVFQAYLDEQTNQRKKDQYTNHLLLGVRYSLIYSTQRFQKEGSFFYMRFDFESSGNLLSLLKNTKLITESDGHYELFGVRYAQYVRGSFDLHQHLDLGKDNWLVFRQFIGLGVPYGNSIDMPFERSFYAGGANGLRGWTYRGVGPGGYVPTHQDIERIGDMQLELNAEYRFPIRNIFKGAVFADAGNVWTFRPNENMPLGEFRFDSFYKQIAFDAGVGLRIDASFLIIRVDLAYALRDAHPNSEGSYWRFSNGLFKNMKLCWGIGYPF